MNTWFRRLAETLLSFYTLHRVTFLMATFCEVSLFGCPTDIWLSVSVQLLPYKPRNRKTPTRNQYQIKSYRVIGWFVFWCVLFWQGVSKTHQRNLTVWSQRPRDKQLLFGANPDSWSDSCKASEILWKDCLTRWDMFLQSYSMNIYGSFCAFVSAYLSLIWIFCLKDLLFWSMHALHGSHQPVFQQKKEAERAWDKSSRCCPLAQQTSEGLRTLSGSSLDGGSDADGA